MSIATKTGDDGSTALMYGRRVAKTDPRVDAYGTVDELNTALGLVRSHAENPRISALMLSVQKELVALMGELALAPEDRARYEKDGYPRLTVDMVDRLTAEVDDLEKNHKISFKGWATPGATRASAFLDFARTTCRRAERRVAAVQEVDTGLNREILCYLNRLSDLCWLYARFEETAAENISQP